MQTPNPIEQTYRERRVAGRKITRLFFASPQLCGFRFPPEILEPVYSSYLNRQDYDPHPKGLSAARSVLANYYQGAGAEVDPENILITSGSSESFFYLFSLLCQAGDNILTPRPAYPLFDHIADLARVSLRHYPLAEDKNWAIDLDALRDRTDERTRAIVLVTPNNPTGAVTSPDQIRAVIDFANAKGLGLICDEVFSEFFFGPGPFPRPMALSRPRLCFTLNGISKMFALPGLKLSWIAVTGEKTLVDSAVDRLETMVDTLLSCHLPIQEALPRLFSEGVPFLRSYREEVRRRAQRAVEILSGSRDLQFVPPSGGFYLMAKIVKEVGLSEEEFVIQLLREKDLFVHPGYFYDEPHGMHFIMSFLHPPEVLQQGLQDLLSFIA